MELDGHLWGMSWSDVGHATLDVVGLVPVVGEVADVANGIWYLAEGNYVDAGLSMSSAIPLAGYGASAVKFGKTGKRIYDGATATADTAKNVDNATDTAKAATPPPTAAKTDQPTAPKQDTDGPSCQAKPNSFVPGTKVVMADGSSKAIEELKVGDRVLATDVETGQNQKREVTNARSVAGKKAFITFTVDTDGKDGSKTGSITSTDNHLTWLPDAGMWVEAKQLKPGMWLQTAAGTWVQITAVKRTVKHERVHNLTVDGLHSYYVLAGATPLLVHNCGQVEYGSTDLSQAVIQERLKLNKKGNNFAAARVVQNGVERIRLLIHRRASAITRNAS
ncbi:MULTISPECIES: polymorphic toxin-type HINT domain-containing protein [unclassified Micromonospora]|uniref:polymorphic toxin-type HINT domain-containing protein n=1 Tax=unclassified Micromonospora TaxID=2617518 RepID=UPI003320D809